MRFSIVAAGLGFFAVSTAVKQRRLEGEEESKWGGVATEHCPAHTGREFLETELPTENWCTACHQVYAIDEVGEQCLRYGIPNRENSTWPVETSYNMYTVQYDGPSEPSMVWLDEHGDMTECECIQMCADNVKCKHVTWYGDDMWYMVSWDSDGDGVNNPRYIDAPAKCVMTLDSACAPSYSGSDWTVWSKQEADITLSGKTYSTPQRDFSGMEDGAHEMSLLGVTAMLVLSKILL